MVKLISDKINRKLYTIINKFGNNLRQVINMLKKADKTSTLLPHKKYVLDSKRLRRINGSFSWIDHRFINDGHIKQLSSIDILLYLFLVAVGDKNGVSYYGEAGICNLLKLTSKNLCRSRFRLIEKDFIKYDGSIYQVLELPAKIKQIPPSASSIEANKVGGVLGELLDKIESRRKYFMEEENND